MSATETQKKLQGVVQAEGEGSHMQGDGSHMHGEGSHMQPGQSSQKANLPPHVDAS